ncbi:hypothetical protein [Halostella litorea]|uniref:hypothetical protein n=1 Tax=Halostella litorea TaxID=2528831 RepID=UPI001091D121|nr:hypothetical protein [Halostella litorea]
MDGNDVPDQLRTAADSDRPRGILTPSDRDFLLGRKTDYTDHSKKQKRNRIRRRVQNAILDFSILFECLEERDRDTVFDPDDGEREGLTQGVTDMLAFLHLGTMGYYTPFKDMLSEGVGKAEQKLAGSNYRMVNVEFNVDPVGQIDVDEVVDKLENDEFAQITDEELRAFVRLLTMSDEFSPEATREEIKDSVDEFASRVSESERARERTVEELTK